MSSINSMDDYFVKALSLFDGLDIDNTLASAGVSHSNEYKLSQFNVFNKLPAFECTVCFYCDNNNNDTDPVAEERR